jgi:hypothetical protein
VAQGQGHNPDQVEKELGGMLYPVCQKIVIGSDKKNSVVIKKNNATPITIACQPRACIYLDRRLVFCLDSCQFFPRRNIVKFDLAKTLSLVRGGLTDHENTWKTYLENTPAWQETAINLTVPLLLANVLLSAVFSRLSGGYSYAPPGQGFLSALLMLLVLAIAGVAVSVFVFNFLAGVFAGKPDLSRAFAAVTFAGRHHRRTHSRYWIFDLTGRWNRGTGFSVQDYAVGPGCPPAQARSAFYRFHRVDYRRANDHCKRLWREQHEPFQPR